RLFFALFGFGWDRRRRDRFAGRLFAAGDHFFQSCRPVFERPLQLLIDTSQRSDLFTHLLGGAFGADAIAFVGKLLDGVEVGGDLPRRLSGQQLGVFATAGDEREPRSGREREGEQSLGPARHPGESRERSPTQNFPASERGTHYEPTWRRSARRLGRPAEEIDAAARST